MAKIKFIEDADQNWDQDPESDSAIETRLLGAEDVYWDSDGTDDINSFTDRMGTERKITGINSGKIPVQQTVREQLSGVQNITDALLALADRAGSSHDSILDDDIEVLLDADLTHEQKQALINDQLRNLGGHVLTVRFPESLDLTISSSFVFSGFNTGKLVIDLNGIELSDAVDTTSLILFQDCSCHVSITGGTLKHTVSPYAVKAVRCPHIYFQSLQFIGSGTASSYALFAEDSDGHAEDCVFSEDQQVLAVGFLSSTTTVAHNTSSNPHNGVLAPLNSPELTGTPTAPTASSYANNTQIATTAFVKTAAGEAVSNHNTSSNPHNGVLASLVSPNFTGTPTAPTASSSANNTQIATTAFVQAVAGNAVNSAGTGAGSAISAHNTSSSAHSGILVTQGAFNSHANGVREHRYLVPAGSVFAFAGNVAIPPGFLLCDGREVSRTSYYDLFNAIGILYGPGDGINTFNIPDFRGMFLRGYQSGLSEEIGSYQGESLPLSGVTLKASGSGDYLAHYPMYGEPDPWGEAGRNASPHVTPKNFAIQWMIKY